MCHVKMSDHKENIPVFPENAKRFSGKTGMVEICLGVYM